MKILVEQLALFILLLSCCIKANIISIFYLMFLLLFLMMSNKPRAMLIMTMVLAISLTMQYAGILTNLTSFNNPQAYPKPFDVSYPNATNI
jgi:hypothetical protein